jgi:hypothetical protein
MPDSPGKGKPQSPKDGSQEKKLPPCQVRFIWEKETHEGTTSHFSDTGMLVMCPSPAPLNARLKFTLAFPFLKKPIEVQGEVVWSNIYGPEEPLLPRGMGVKFMGVDKEKSRLLGELASRYRGQENHFSCYYS